MRCSRPGAARAAAPGINIGYVEASRGQVERAARTGADYARLFVLWSDFQPSGPGQSIAGSRLAEYDAAVRRLRAAKVKPILVVVGAPASANGSSDRLVPPAEPSGYARFAGALARHFRGRVVAYEIWNEEDETVFWHAPVDPARYAGLLRASYSAVRDGDPAAKVLVGPLDGQQLRLPRPRCTAPGSGATSTPSPSTPTRRAWTAGPSASTATPAARSGASRSWATARCTRSWPPTATAPSRSG